MKKFTLDPTESTPQVTLDPQGEFEIAGKSVPTNPAEFYAPVSTWIEAYARDAAPAAILSVRLEHLNTGSSKALRAIFQLLQQIPGSRIHWYFQEDDEDMEEMGEEFAELVEIPFELKAF